MRKTVLLLVLVVAIAGCDKINERLGIKELNRYQMVVAPKADGSNGSFIVDNKEGAVWLLQYDDFNNPQFIPVNVRSEAEIKEQYKNELSARVAMLSAEMKLIDPTWPEISKEHRDALLVAQKQLLREIQPDSFKVKLAKYSYARSGRDKAQEKSLRAYLQKQGEWDDEVIYRRLEFYRKTSEQEGVLFKTLSTEEIQKLSEKQIKLLYIGLEREVYERKQYDNSRTSNTTDNVMPNYFSDFKGSLAEILLISELGSDETGLYIDLLSDEQIATLINALGKKAQASGALDLAIKLGKLEQKVLKGELTKLTEAK